MGKAFLGIDHLKSLSKIGPPFGFVHSTDAIVFVDNHDLQRNSENESTTIHFRQPRLLQTATVFMLAHNYGSPVVMSSFSFNKSGEGPPVRLGSMDICSPFDKDCDGWMLEHRFPSIMEMVKFRNAVRSSPVRSWQNLGENQIAFCRGSRGFVVFNNNPLEDLDQEVFVCVPKGDYCDILSIDGNGKCLNIIYVSDKRIARIQISQKKEIPAIAIHRLKQI